MATVRSLPSWVLLDSHLSLDVEDESGWAAIKCARSEAIGCGDDGDLVVKGLTLMAHLVDPPAVSFLGIRSSSAVLRFKAGRHVRSAEILVAEKDLVVITIRFNNKASYYLIYDATDASLAMTPHLEVSNPRSRRWGNVPLPLPVRRGNGRYALVHMATFKAFQQQGKICWQDALCLWPPSPSSSQSSSSSIVPWQLKDPLFPEEMPAPRESYFSVQQVFSFQGMAFWVDLLQGVLYCKHSDLLSDQRDRVQVHFIDLPPGCRPDRTDGTDEDSADTFRTMGCAGDSIRFVCVSGHLSTDKEAIADCKVTMWTLTPYLWDWKKDGELRIGDLWKQQEFRRAGLSTSERPTVTMLSSQEEDGVLYLVLPGYYVDDEGYTRCLEQHMLRVDMRGKRLLSSRCLPSTDRFCALRIFGSDFFEHLESQHLSPLAVPAQEKFVTNVLKREEEAIEMI